MTAIPPSPPTSSRYLIHHHLQKDRNNNDVIRTRLLNRLGIQRKETDLLSQHLSTSSTSSLEGPSKRRKSMSLVSCSMDPLQQPNNNNHSNNDYAVPLQYTLVETLPFDRKPRIQFADNVQVRQIPHHRDYGEEHRRSLWRGLQEIQADAERNDFEYFVDGEHWEWCKEEDEFLVWQETGELLHPATYERYEQEAMGIVDDDDEDCEEQNDENNRDQSTAMITSDEEERPMLRRGKSVWKESSGESCSSDDSSLGSNSSSSTSGSHRSKNRKRKNQDPSSNPLRRSPKVSSFAEYSSDQSESDEDLLLLQGATDIPSSPQ